MGKVYIHYGHTAYDPELFIDIDVNSEVLCDGRKPINGLWWTSAESKHGWKELILSDSEIYINEKWRLEKSFRFTLADDAKVLLIQDEDDFINVLQQYMLNKRIDYCSVPVLKYEINWTKLATDFDAIEAYAGSNEFLNTALYGWDCDSICVFHKMSLIIIS